MQPNVCHKILVHNIMKQTLRYFDAISFIYSKFTVKKLPTMRRFGMRKLSNVTYLSHPVAKRNITYALADPTDGSPSSSTKPNKAETLHHHQHPQTPANLTVCCVPQSDQCNFAPVASVLYQPKRQDFCTTPICEDCCITPKCHDDCCVTPCIHRPHQQVVGATSTIGAFAYRSIG